MSKMLEEIRQQPAALERTFRSEIKGIEKLRVLFAKNRPKFIVLAARGTSDNAAQFGRYLLEIATGIPVSLAAPSIFTLYGARVDYKDALVVAISQSGESTDTNLVLERARECGAFTIGITNEASSTLAKLAEHVILVRAGREKSVAATKTYTGQLMAVNMLAYALGAPVSLDELRALPDSVAGALKLEAEIREKSGRYRYMENAVVVGRGLNYANAYEWALKLMETCYVVAERFSSADFLHGPIAMVEQSFPVFLFAPAGVTWPSIREMIARVLNNLIGNAVKFAPKGGVVRVAATSDERGAQVSVSDNGPGIPAAQIPHLFDRFWQAPGQARKGSGLGLYICLLYTSDAADE